MLIHEPDLATIYEEICKNYHETQTTVRMLVACDVDSICTVRVLKSLLQTDQIPYKIIPMRSYQDLDQRKLEFRQLIKDGSLNTMIFINLGAMCDLEEVLFTDEEKEDEEIGEPDFIVDNYRVSLYIIDHHRPVHLQNVHSAGLVYVLSRDPDDLNRGYPPVYLDESDSEDDEDMKEEKDENEIDIDEDEDDTDSSLSSDEEDGGPPRKRRRLNTRVSERESRERAKRERQERRATRRAQFEREIRQYYTSTYHTSHSAGIAFKMARDLHKDDNHMLWCSILGLTSQFVHERISRDKYDDEVAVYQDEVRRKNQPFHTNCEVNRRRKRRRREGGNLFANFEDDDENDGIENFVEDDVMSMSGSINGSIDNNYGGSRVTTMDGGVRSDYSNDLIDASKIIQHRPHNHIQFSLEFRFVLMRHWTLYESMLNSDFIATRLMVWNQKGKERLKILLAKMAIPLNEAQQPYSNMKRDVKKKLPHALEIHADAFDLKEDLTYASFTKRHGGHQSVSASDVVYALTTMMESDVLLGSDFVRSRNPNLNPSEMTDDEIWQSNFFCAHDALDLSVGQQDLLDLGIMHAKQRQMSIVNMASTLIGKKLIQRTSLIRYAVIDHNNRFQSPNILIKLALFLVEAIRVTWMRKERYRMEERRKRDLDESEGKKFVEKPFLLCSKNVTHNTHIVVGIPPNSTFGDIRKSKFGIAFKEATEETRARVCQDSFEGTIIEVQSDDFKDWLEALHDHLGKIMMG